MRYKIYYKKWLEGINRPVICDRTDNFQLIDFSIRKEDVGKAFNPDKFADKVRNLVLKETGGININFRNAYVGDNNITWTYGKSLVSEGEIVFN